RGARDLLAKMNAADLPLMIEPNGGTAAISALSTGPSAKVLAALPPSFRPKGTLPCTLLVDSSGRVRGRSVGAVMEAADPSQKADPASRILTEHHELVDTGGRCLRPRAGRRLARPSAMMAKSSRAGFPNHGDGRKPRICLTAKSTFMSIAILPNSAVERRASPR